MDTGSVLPDPDGIGPLSDPMKTKAQALDDRVGQRAVDACGTADRESPDGASAPTVPDSDRAEQSAIATMSKRADFLAANRGRRAPMPGFVLLVRDRQDGSDAMRLGITVTKKIGGAVVRNRMKRRFRALARVLLPAQGVPGADHVLIGREGGIERDYAALQSELAKALRKLREPAKPGEDAPRRPAQHGRGKGRGKPAGPR